MSCCSGSALFLNPLIPLTSRAKHNYRSKSSISRQSPPARIRCSQNQNEQQLNLSVLRFTLGIMSFSFPFLVFYEMSLKKPTIFLFFLRNTWIGRILLAQIHWICIWSAFSIEPFSGLGFFLHYSSSARK